MTVFLCYTIDPTSLSASPKLVIAKKTREAAEEWVADKTDGMYNSGFFVEIGVED